MLKAHAFRAKLVLLLSDANRIRAFLLENHPAFERESPLRCFQTKDCCSCRMLELPCEGYICTPLFSITMNNNLIDDEGFDRFFTEADMLKQQCHLLETELSELLS